MYFRLDNEVIRNIFGYGIICKQIISYVSIGLTSFAKEQMKTLLYNEVDTYVSR